MHEAFPQQLPDEAPGIAEGRLAMHRERMILGLAAAIREQGLARTQVSDIVRHAGASRRTFYRCFPDKDSCFIALSEVLSTGVRSYVTAAIDHDAPAADQIDQAVGAFFSIVQEDTRLLTAFRFELPMLGQPGLAIGRKSIEDYANLLGSRLRARAAIEPDLEEPSMNTLVMVISGLEGLLERTVVRGESTRDVIPEAQAFARRVLLPRGERDVPQAA